VPVVSTALCRTAQRSRDFSPVAALVAPVGELPFLSTQALPEHRQQAPHWQSPCRGSDQRRRGRGGSRAPLRPRPDASNEIRKRLILCHGGALYHFVSGPEYLKKDREKLLTFYDFPAEHWMHTRVTGCQMGCAKKRKSQELVLAHLRAYSVVRRVDCKWQITIYSRHHYVGEKYRGQSLYVVLDPIDREWVFTTAEDVQLRRKAAVELTRERIIRLQVSHPYPSKTRRRGKTQCRD
jgi:hypothetical protein